LKLGNGIKFGSKSSQPSPIPKNTSNNFVKQPRINNLKVLKMRKLALIGFFVSIIACNQSKSTENSKSEKDNSQEIINTMLNKMYVGDLESKYPLKDTLLFSKEIVELNKKCDSLTILDSERIANSKNPSDKPIQREGSNISSFYEGVTDFKIKEIKENGENIEVLVTLSNKFYKDQKPWNEKIMFITEGGLKIDNIFFDEKVNIESSLKNNLKRFSQEKIK